ncbi:MAG TPA: carbohydrate binding domain-containing protein [Candidatus Saccharimonadales bacterium]|jgi:hypothetical protein
MVAVFVLSALMLLVSQVITHTFTGRAEAAVGNYKTINFQGKVVNTNGTNVPDASYTFKFRIYTAASGATATPCATTCVWEETKSLTTVNGIFQTNLGDATTLPGSVNFNTDSLYIGVVFNGDTEMSPRVRLTSVPYAFNADMLDGLDSSALAQLSPSSQQTGSLNVSGNITTGGTLQGNTLDAATSGALTIGSTNTTGITIARNTTVSSGQTLSLQGNNALSLGSTTAAGGIVFRDGTGNNRTVTLSAPALNASYALNLPGSAPIAGAQCLQTASGSTTNLTFSACGPVGTFVTLQGSTPGTPDTGNINISGVGIAASFNAGSFDQTTATVLNIGTSTATSIVLGKVGITTSAPGILTVGTTSNPNNYQFYVSGSTGLDGNLTFSAGSARTVQVAQAGSGAGNNLELRGGAAASGSGSNGGNVVLTGGVGDGAGGRGVVLLDTPAFSTVTNADCSSNCTLAQTNIDNKAAVIVNATALNVTVTMPDPTYQIAGRLVYVTAANGSNDFTLSINGGGTGNQIAMRQNTSATMVWNGTDWTAAGASSSTTLQAAYDNTLAAAGGAEILLNNTSSSNGLTIRNSASNPIIGSVFEVQSSIGTNLLSVNNSAIEYVANGGAETTATFSTDWGAVGPGTVDRHTNLANVATGQASASVNSAPALNSGFRNRLTANLAPSTKYQVSFTGKMSSGTFSGLTVSYSRNGGTNFADCVSYSTQALTTTGWSKVTCTFTTDSTPATSPYLYVRQPDTTARSYYIDNVSVTLSTISSTPPNVQIGGGIYGGPATLFTLDRSSSPPVAAGNDVYYGSMYYDTTSGRIQCYQANGWGACGSAPDTFINLVPEYGGAVLNGTGIGTMTADFCSNQSTVLAINTSLCSTGQALNFYKWTSPQATQQTYSIYISYQLPGGFKQFQSDSTIQLTARTDNVTNGSVSYELFRSEGGQLTQCYDTVNNIKETLVTTTANSWQTQQINGNELSTCGFTTASANNFAIFKINVKAKSNANVYVGALSFTITNQ